MFTAYRIQPVVGYEGSDESRDWERFSTLADAQKFWDAKVADARFDEADDPEMVAEDCGLKLYWTLYGVQEDGTDEAIADRETETDCFDLFGQIIHHYRTDEAGLLLPVEPEPSDEAQRKLIKEWFPWIDTNVEADGADTVETMAMWWDHVGGEG